jgi:hypothetical protein
MNDLYNKNYKSLNKEINGIFHVHGSTESLMWQWLSSLSNLYVQSNQHQNSNDVFHWVRKINLKVHMDAKWTLTRQSNCEQKESHWRYHNSRLQTMLQSNSNKNSVLLAWKQTWRTTENSRRSKDKSTQLTPSRFQQRNPKYGLEKR